MNPAVRCSKNFGLFGVERFFAVFRLALKCACHAQKNQNETQWNTVSHSPNINVSDSILTLHAYG